MTDPTATPVRIIGCDVGMASIAVFDGATGRHNTIANGPAALAAFAATLEPACLVICEACRRP